MEEIYVGGGDLVMWNFQIDSLVDEETTDDDEDDSITDDLVETYGDEYDEAELEEVRRQIESDDPGLVELLVGHEYGYHPNDDDWERDGKNIGKNTHIEDLIISLRRTADWDWDLIDNSVGINEEDAVKFFNGVARNRSIQYLDLRFSDCDQDCDLFYGEALRALIPFFKNNRNFNRLHINGSGNECDGLRLLTAALLEFDSLEEFWISSIEGDGTSKLIEALARHSRMASLFLVYSSLTRKALSSLAILLSNPKSKLARLTLAYNDGVDDKGAVILADGLGNNHTLEDLDLHRTKEIGETGWKAIFKALQSSSCNLRNLNLSFNRMNAATLQSLSDALVIKTTLESLDLHCCTSTPEAGWQSLFKVLANQKCSLERLHLERNGFNDEVALCLADALQNNSSLKKLGLSGNKKINFPGWRALFDVLLKQSSALEILHLKDSGVNDETLNYLTNALGNNAKLKELNLVSNNKVTGEGWATFLAVLQKPTIALEKLDLQGNRITDDLIAKAMPSLANNNKLKELLLDFRYISIHGQLNLATLLHNMKSIMDLYESNHTLCKFCEDNSEPFVLNEILQINQNNTKNQAARIKIIKRHFDDGFVTQPFIDMDQKLLPYAISWMGRYDDEHRDKFYQFIRSRPSLFDIEFRDNKKRKRED